ncbi:MAG: DNA primase [Candidatus Magasanikbacteria bacterium RIFCSPHIGHO2_02_FULL_51_14]|uniref:DNA primase n=1 Tax=Candidatus Magasanikbacteria bacterium RIFCSPHIGHO2_02_FULL_51_14 TaxID=1798683 RepID=A0A1F6MHP9_9BACT|nr:MAG: DNA primase [Candidatus Magasanikbacteria bacterium RIFCSPHIGHO2_02_FULL_51_14]
MSDTQLIKDKIDIADFISEYVQLKPSGVNQKGLCPFHQEKTPSFMVSRERQSWHCFGCGKGGDIFTFLEEMEGMDFVEALRMLAERAGVELTFRENQGERSQRDRLKQINSEAARFFHNFLLKMEQSRQAREYLKERGLKDETIEEWRVGFVPNQWDLLTKYLLKKGHGIDDLVASGLTIKRENADVASGRGFFDRFRGRIMFPIWDVHGGVVGFTGRQLVPDEKSGKYVNTPQTALYDKSRVVFGLNFAKQEIKKKDLIVMVEGQMDVIATHQAGMKNVVASSGTALTEHQVALLKRYSENISMAFDSDSAGEAAAKRGIGVAVSQGMHVKVIQIPEGAGKDPDECVKIDRTVWFHAVESACDVMDWSFERAFRGKNLFDPRQKQMVVDALLPDVALIPYAVEKDHWLRELAARIGVDVAVLREDMARLKGGKSEIRNPKSEKGKTEEHVRKDRMSLLTQRLFGLLLRYPQLITDHWSLITGLELSTAPYVSLYEAIKKQYTDAGAIDVDALRVSVASNEKENPIDVLLMKGELDFSAIQESDAKKECEKLIEEIRKEWNKARRKVLQAEIERAEKGGDTSRLAILIEEFQSLQ